MADLGIGLAAANAGAAPASAAHRVAPQRRAAHGAHVPKPGGSVTVLIPTGSEGWSQGLDPGKDTGGPQDETEFQAIFDDLVNIGTGGKLVYDLATGSSVSDHGKTITIDLRKGVRFSDGTRFDAYAVRWNFERDLKCPGICKPPFPVSSITMPRGKGGDEVLVHLSSPYPGLINAMIGTNWNFIASPSALKRMGEHAFSFEPVGAGPFEVVSDAVDSALVLKKNPRYWEKGRPYLNRLILRGYNGGDQGAYEAMRAGDAQVYAGMETPSLLKAFKASFTTTLERPTSVYDVQLNTAKAPFDNIKAREAIYYATDPKPIDRAIFDGHAQVSESFTGPGGLFYEPKVPHYRSYDLAKAKALVQQLGGFSVNLFTVNDDIAIELDEALAKQWEAAGIHVTLSDSNLADFAALFLQGKWQASLTTLGNFDPVAGPLTVRLLSKGLFSGVHDPHLDAMLTAADDALSPSVRAKDYAAVAEYLSEKAYVPLLFAFGSWTVAARNVCGPGITSPLPEVTIPPIPWQDVSARC